MKISSSKFCSVLTVLSSKLGRISNNLPEKGPHLPATSCNPGEESEERRRRAGNQDRGGLEVTGGRGESRAASETRGVGKPHLS